MKQATNLDKCLQYAEIENLPEEWDEKTPFLRGILLVEKISGENDYLIGSVDDTLTLFATKTFNSTIIGKYLKAYPYKMSDGKSPSLENNVVKVKMDDIKTIEENLDSNYFGIEGVTTINDAKEWIMANGNSNLAKSDKKEKLKANIEKIKSNLEINKIQE